MSENPRLVHMSKRVVIVAVLAALAASVAASAGCGGGDEESASDGEKVLRVATSLSFPPFEYEEKGELTGFEVELVDGIANNLGYETEWKNVPFGGLFTAVSAGKFDVAAAAINGWAPEGGLLSDIVDERTQIVSFTRPIYLVRYVLIGNGSENPTLTEASDLTEGMSVAVPNGSIEAEYANKVLAPEGIDVIGVPGSSQAYSLVASGQADATFSEREAALGAVEKAPTLQVGGETKELSAAFCLAMTPDLEPLRQEINEAIGEFIASGEYAELYGEYFRGEKPPTLPSDSFAHQAS